MKKKGLEGIFRIIFSATIILVLSSCEEDFVNNENGPNIRPLTSDEQFFVASSNQLAVDLLQNKDDLNQNVLISPISVGATLGIIGNALSENEYMVLGEKLGLPVMPRIEINKAFYEVSTMLPYLDKHVSIDFHNSLWTKHDLASNNDFYTQVLAYYNADIQELFTGKNFEPKHIGKWTQLNTNNKINSINRFNYNSDFQIVNLGTFKGSFFEETIAYKRTVDFFDENGNAHRASMNFFPNKKILQQSVNGVKIYSIPVNNANFELEISMDENILSVINYDDNMLSSSFVSANLLIPDIKSSYEFYLNHDFARYNVSEALNDALVQNFNLKNQPNREYTFLNKSLVEITGKHEELALNNELEELSETVETIVFNKPFYYFLIEKNSNLIIFEGKFSLPQ